MLTLFYAGATFLQSWRIQCACNKLAEQLANHASISFYALPLATDDGFDASLATSELCNNRHSAKVSEILWLQGRQRGCCLQPLQSINITPWISFSTAPSLLPFAYAEVKPRPVGDGDQERLRILMETETHPDKSSSGNFLRLEEYGELIAWRIDSHLAVLLETNVECFTKLIVSTYLQNNLHINDDLRLLRIQSIRDEGEPQPFHLVASHLRKSTRSTIDMTPDEWQKHLEGLRSLCVLANQATEFQYKQNLTEGKTGVVKPDLIPSDKHKKLQAEELQDKPSHSKTPNSVSVDGTRFTTTQVLESPVKVSPSSSDNKLSELEKLAALTAQQLKQKSPSKITITSNETKSQSMSSPINTITSKESATTSKAMSTKTTIEAMSNKTRVETRSSTPIKTKMTDEATASTSVNTKISVEPKSKIINFETSTCSTPMKTKTSDEATKPMSTKIIDEVPTSTAIKSKISQELATTSTPIKTKNTTEIIDKSQNIEPPSINKNLSPRTAKADDVKVTSAATNSSRKLSIAKPLNILVYADSASVRESIFTTLKKILQPHMYTVYQLSSNQAILKNWLESTALLIVCGDVSSTSISEILVDYFLLGGKVLSLCSDILYFVLPNYRTAEVREHELVQFSYDRWQKVKMMHHIFCYQPSPVKKNFSTDSDDAVQSTLIKKQPAMVCPRSIDLKDLRGDRHSLDVRVLGTEEIWHTPSLLLATSSKSGGRAVFSQVHLESNPSLFENDEAKYAILKENDKIRLDILSDLLSKHLGVLTQPMTSGNIKGIVYSTAFFLGHHEAKFELLEKLKTQNGGTSIKTDKLTFQFCGRDDKALKAEFNFLPILTHSCPEDFSTVEYFENLKTKYIGRLVIYAPIITSTMHIVEPLVLTSGLVVIARQQTDGVGRSGNQWLSPAGCVMSSMQLHLNLNSPLGQRLAVLQHLVGTAIVNAFKSHHLYKVLDLGVKWPNDIYVNGSTKIGGLITKTIIEGEMVIANLGFGINLDNSRPTTCLNDLIDEYNGSHNTKLPHLKYETLLSLIFNELERVLEQVENEGLDDFYDLYIKLWLHNDQSIKICTKEGKEEDAKIIGVDDDCFLRVRLSSGVIETVQPDGNSFDMLKGLIVPKYFGK